MLNSTHLARALERLSGKLHTLDQIFPSAGIYRYTVSLGLSHDCHMTCSHCQVMTKTIIQIHTDSHAHCLCQNFASTITDIRQELAMFKGATPISAPPLNEQSITLYAAIKTGLDSSLTNLLVN